MRDDFFSSEYAQSAKPDGAPKVFFYGDAIADFLLLEYSKSLPRYGHLARKAMLYYGGDRYNPHKHGMAHEVFLREMIRDLVSDKVLFKKPYDWTFIDHAFRKYIGICLGIDLKHDEAVFQKGLQEGRKANAGFQWDKPN